jgi:hypothetical protein
MSTGKRIYDDNLIKEFFKTYDYQKDPEYTEWEKILYNKKFTFEDTVSFCKIDWKFNKEKTKKEWLKYIREWNMTRYEKDIDPQENSIIGYAAITYLYIVLPYGDILRSEERSEKINEFQAKLINICLLHETGKCLDCFKNYDMLTLDDPPNSSDKFEEYLHEQYNTASWFLTFLIYLDQKGIIIGHNGATWS